MYRHFAPDGSFAYDTVALEDAPQRGTPLLRPVMAAGKRLPPHESLANARARALAQIACLPPQLRELDPAAAPYRVEIGPSLRTLAEELDRMPH